MVRSFAQQSDAASSRGSAATPMPWDRHNGRDDGASVYEASQKIDARDPYSDSRETQRMRIERYGPTSQHSRTNSGNESSGDHHSQENFAASRQHAYDVHAMESTLPDEMIKPYRPAIQPPLVLVRSEFPTITRSSHQQSLTCLVTVEVPDTRSSQQGFDNHMSSAAPAAQSINATSFSFHTAQDQFAPLQTSLELIRATADLKSKIDNWHGLEFSKFGGLRLFGVLRIGKDQKLWQELECYLFEEMLICVKEKNGSTPISTSDGRQPNKCVLKGSILIKRHLQEVQAQRDRLVLTLNLAVKELPTFHLKFQDHREMHAWKNALLDVRKPAYMSEVFPGLGKADEETDTSGTDDESDQRRRGLHRNLSNPSSLGGPKSTATAPTEYSVHRLAKDQGMIPSLHTPMDIVVVVPVSSSMQGLKIRLLKDTLRFMVSNLGVRDRMGLVTFGSSSGSVPLVGMTSKRWGGWNDVLSSIKPFGQKSLRADVVDGANVAMDLLMQRQGANPISTILLISDSSTSDTEGVNFVVSRAEAAKVGIYSFGLGSNHKPDSMIELSSRTKASYFYVKDWMMLRECVAGCLGSLQSISHKNVKLRLKLPEGSPAKLVKISGAMSSTRRATGREAEATIGDLRFGDKRDILVQLVIEPDQATAELPQDHWESLISNLQAVGGSIDNEDLRVQSVEELPLLQADLSYADLQADNLTTQLSRPSLLTITVLNSLRKSRQNSLPMTPPIPPHPSIVQRRMELLASDMLTRALTLVSKQQNDSAHRLLTETRSILRGLAKGGLPPLPPSAANSAGSGIAKRQTPPKFPSSPKAAPNNTVLDPPDRTSRSGSDPGTPNLRSIVPSSGIDPMMMDALDADIESALEWINHPTVFGRDSRKAVLQAIGVIATQRGYTFRSAAEGIWAERIGGVKRLVEAARMWREGDDEIVVEEPSISDRESIPNR